MTFDPQAAAQGDRDAGRLPSGSRFAGGRYIIGKRERQGLFADLYQATDATTDTPLSIHLIDPRLVQSRQLLDQLADTVRRAAAVEHKSIAHVIELAVEGQHIYVATELVEGHSLRELLDRKRETGTVGFGAKGAVNILTHVAGALSAAGGQLAHGAVTIDGVAVSRNGRIRVTDYGLSPLVPVLAGLGRQIPGCAPEVLGGSLPTAASDVYCLGALLYEVLVGAPPVKGCTRPSQAVPGIPAAVDQIIARAMSASPERRYPTPAALVEAASAHLAEAPRITASHPPQPVSAPAGARPGARGAPGPGESHPSLAEALASAGPKHSAQIAVSSALTAAVAERDEKWLISKGKLDYGPFSLAQVAEQVQANLILPGHVIIDKDTGHRSRVETHPLLHDLVDSAKQKRDELRRAHAEVQHASQEKRRGTALYAFIGIGVLALGGGVYFLVHKLSAAKRDEGVALQSLEAGSLQAKISFPSKAERQNRARRNAAARKARSTSGAAGGVAGGWDDSLNLDLSDEDEGGGGSDRLTDDQVNPVIQRQGGGLGRCLTSTTTHNAMIEFIVKPTGGVSHVRVNGQTGTPVANCIRGVMTRMQFPSFNGMRSKHYFDMAY
jgi:serine/threonine protein kinase